MSLWVLPLALSTFTTTIIFVVGGVALALLAFYVLAFFSSQRIQEDAAALARDLDLALEFPDFEKTQVIWRMVGTRASRRAEILFEEKPQGRVARFRLQTSISRKKQRLVQGVLAELGTGERLQLGEDGFLEAQHFVRILPPRAGKERMSELGSVADRLEADLVKLAAEEEG